jgi:hypothetical protein
MKSKTLSTAEKHAALLTLIETKTKDGKKALDENTQSQNDLTKAWQDFTSKTGPTVVGMWDGLNTAASRALGILSTYVDLMDKLGKIGPFGDHSDHSASPRNLSSAGSLSGFGRGARASGGRVGAGGAYTVGEHGPETLVMGNQGGSIIPNGAAGGGGIHIHLHGILPGDGPYWDHVANQLAQRLTFTTGR